MPAITVPSARTSRPVNGTSAHGAGCDAAFGVVVLNARAPGIRRWAHALELARENPEREVIFFAIGFETTAPSTAITVLQAQAQGIENFTVFCNHVTIGPPLKAILDAPELRLDGLIAPGHVSTVIGSHPYDFIASDYGRPVVVAGFEPLDILQSVLMLVRQLAQSAGVDIATIRGSGPQGRVLESDVRNFKGERRTTAPVNTTPAIQALAAERLREDLRHADRERGRAAGARKDRGLADILRRLGDHFRRDHEAPARDHLRRLLGARADHRRWAVHHEIDAGIEHARGGERHDRDERLHEHAAVADEADVALVLDHLRRGAGGD